MASQIASPHRFTVDDVLAMYRAGILGDLDRVELVDGVLLEMTPPGPQHAATLERLTEHFVKAVTGDLRVRVQDTPLMADGGFLLPDLFVFERIPYDRLPDTALLVIEVAFTSRGRDVEKAATYAAAGVPEYWIVDVDRDELLVHRAPVHGAYATVDRYTPGDAVAPLIDVPPVDVAALLAR